MAKNPYTLLGVKKDVSEAEIRKAYRKMAKTLHPDVNPGDKKAEERFKEVTAAYNLLTNETLRRQYDTGQVDASGQQQNPFAGGFQRGGGQPFQTGFGGFGGMGGQDDMADLFSSLFGMNMGGMRGGMNRGGYQARPVKGADVRYKLTIAMTESLQGLSRNLADGVKIKIPAGVRDGQTLRLRGKGQAGQHGGPAGDAKVDIAVRPHKYLKRDGDNLFLTLPVSLREALKGGKVEIPMPTGSVSLTIPPGTNSGKKLRLKGKGVGSGHLTVTISIVLTPEELAQNDSILADLPDKSGHPLRKSLI